MRSPQPPAPPPLPRARAARLTTLKRNRPLVCATASATGPTDLAQANRSEVAEDSANGAAIQPAVNAPATAGGPEGSSSAPRETDDDARKRRRIKRFSPPTPSEIARGKSVEAAARIAAGRAAQDPSAGDTIRVIMHHDDTDCRAAARKEWADADHWFAQKTLGERPAVVESTRRGRKCGPRRGPRDVAQRPQKWVQDVAQDMVHKTWSKRNGPTDTGQVPEVVVQDGRAQANAVQGVVHETWSNDRKKGDNIAPKGPRRGPRHGPQDMVQEKRSNRHGPRARSRGPRRARPSRANTSAKAAPLPSARDARTAQANAVQDVVHETWPNDRKNGSKTWPKTWSTRRGPRETVQQTRAKSPKSWSKTGAPKPRR